MNLEPLLDLAVYVVPPEDHPLYQICAGVLGWDCRREVQVERTRLPGIPDDQLANWIGNAAAYGPHATLAGWMQVPTRHRERIVDDLAQLSRRFSPIQLERGRFPAVGDFWHPATAPFQILVAVFDEPLGALRALHSEVVVRFNPLASTSVSHQRLKLPVFNRRHRWRIEHYHEPLILEDFAFHVSFATSTPSADAVDRLRRAIVDTTGLFEARDHTSWLIDELTLFERRADGFWRIAEAFPLTG